MDRPRQSDERSRIIDRGVASFQPWEFRQRRLGGEKGSDTRHAWPWIVSRMFALKVGGPLPRIGEFKHMKQDIGVAIIALAS